MYLSRLLIDVGEDPDRPRPGRLWLRKLYRVHQRLCMAFPSASRKSSDADFLKPFKPEDFEQQVHVARGAEAGFLFRLDPLPGDGVAILVQSALKPDWEYAFHNAGHLLVREAPPHVKPFDPSFAAGQLLQFRLRANPTKKKLSENRPDRKNGKRVGLYKEDEQRDWLDRKGQDGGFRVVSCHVIPEGKTHSTKPDDESRRTQGAKTEDEKPERKKMPLLSVRFDGVLQVTDPEALLQTLRGGIGSAKAFGFGLLSLARCD